MEYPFSDKPLHIYYDPTNEDIEQYITDEMNPCDCNNDKNCQHCKRARELVSYLYPTNFVYL